MYLMIITNHVYINILGNERPQLKDIYNYVVIESAPNWKELGRNLSIDENLLNIIEKDNPNDCENCCSKMLSNWLDQTPHASWGILLDAARKTQDNVNKLPSGAEILDPVADRLSGITEKLDTAADKISDTNKKLDAEADRLSGTNEKLDTAANKLVDAAANKLPRVVNQLHEAIERLPKEVDNKSLDNSAGINNTCTYT